MRLALWVSGALTAALYAALGYVTFGRLKPAAEGLMPLDFRIGGYSPAQVHDYLDALSAAGRSDYLGPMRVFDTLFPPMLALFLCLSLMALTRGWFMWSRVVLLVPIGGYMVMDFCENALVADLLRAGTEGFDPTLAGLASQFTVTKWVLLVASVTLVAGVWLRDRLNA